MMASKSRVGLKVLRRGGANTAIAAALAASACFAPAAAAVESTVQVIYSFTGGADGKYPEEALVERAGVLYGTTFNGGNAGDCGTVFGLTPVGAKTFTTVLGSQNGCAAKSLAVATDGTLYGTTETAGVGANPAIVYQGSAFRISTTGTLTALHLFDAAGPSYPKAGFVAGRDGSFYGTTSRNGGNANGTVFRLTPGTGTTVTITQLHGFSAAQPSQPGAVPLTRLIEDATTTGTFYGTTSGAGGVVTAGTLFRIQSNSTYQLVRSFSRENERASGPLVQASDGKLYGSTSGGGANGQGMVFRISTDGSNYQELHSFSAATDQLSAPHGGLVAGTDGNLYGVAGGVFRVTPGTGVVARLINTSTVNSTVGTSISGNTLTPTLSGLLWASDGNLYAAAKYGGAAPCTGGSVAGTWGCGAVVKIVPGDGTNLGGSSGGGGGTGGTDGGDSGGGGDGTTLGLLLLALAAGCGISRHATARVARATRSRDLRA
jgi:uncharacterized repeat protein (TIGR03803 family)